MRAWLALVLLVLAGAVRATDPIGLTCPDSGLFTRGGMLTQICWPCFFPIVIGPVPIGSVLNIPSDDSGPVCLCPGRFGIPTPGIKMAMWHPGVLIESTRQPWCSMALGRSLISSSVGGGLERVSRWGGPGRTGATKDRDGGYYHMHYWKFPVGALLDLVRDSVCVSEAGTDMDLAYVTELDPTWQNDELAMITHPEASLFASAPAQAACIADAVASTATRPVRSLFWCAGSWGPLYPLTGHGPASGSPVREASLSATRGLAMMHRRGLAKKTYGSRAVCRNHRYYQLPKQQYRIQTMYPIPELLSNHWIGASTLRWGDWRGIPGVGEDFMWLVWSYESCCVNF